MINRRTKRPSRARGQSEILASARIEDHALIGDLRTAALVTRSGSLDWLCLPDFDSDACFAALLGTADNGHWTIAPSSPVRDTRRRYRPDTLILETDFETDDGVLRLIDFMPPRHSPPYIVRTIVCLRGEVSFRAELAARFAFGRAIPSVTSSGDATKVFAGPDALYLRDGTGTPPPLVCEQRLSAGERRSYVCTWGRPYQDLPPALDPDAAERQTETYWTDWCKKIRTPTRYRDEVVRSLITLKACIYQPTGGIVAAPTTSLPETPGGKRNWDYRFCWLRDAALTVHALAVAGLAEEAQAFGEWMLRAIAGDPTQTQIMYGIRGERRLSEVELDWLPGYQGARPVRVGNAAYQQFQLDVLGEVGKVLYEIGGYFGSLRPQGEQWLLEIAEYAAVAWTRPDHSIWEMRGQARFFTASKVAAWSAIDGAIRWFDARRPHDHEQRIEELRKKRQAIFDEVCREGYSQQLGTFTQYYGGEAVDASLLAIPMFGFLPIDDARVKGTVAAIERELMQDGLLLRYRPELRVDGLRSREGAFLACSFWLVQVYQMMGRQADAERLFARLLECSNDLGLLAEEYDPVAKQQLGNFPQAFSHFALVNAAYRLNEEGDSKAAA